MTTITPKKLHLKLNSIDHSALALTLKDMDLGGLSSPGILSHLSISPCEDQTLICPFLSCPF